MITDSRHRALVDQILDYEQTLVYMGLPRILAEAINRNEACLLPEVGDKMLEWMMGGVYLYCLWGVVSLAATLFIFL